MGLSQTFTISYYILNYGGQMRKIDREIKSGEEMIEILTIE
ncbi:hypothetical protein [Fusobacterium canifelinum]|nr:hypothetical protein [Fusobacterium canifelinum]